MLTEIFKDTELTYYLTAMAIDGCEINIQVHNEIYKCLQGQISHKEMIENIVSEWKRQSDSERE